MHIRQGLSCCLLLLVAIGVAAEEGPVSGSGHRFEVGKPRIYSFAADQVVAQRTAGDDLVYESRLRWDFVLVPQSVTDDAAVVRITFTRIEALMTGPGAEASTPRLDKDDTAAGTIPRAVAKVTLYRFASDDPATTADPLFGHYGALTGRPLDLTVDPRSGAVTRIEGLEAVVAAVVEQTSQGSGDPDAFLVAETKRRFDPAALCLVWSRIFQVPVVGTDTVALSPDGDQLLPRRWEGATWTLALPADAPTPNIVIAGDPTPVTITVTGLSGQGGVDLRDGILREVRGKIIMDLGGTALTQEVIQQQTITWHCVLRDLSAP